MSYSVIRSHEICAGHRVVGHESKCRHLHGHNYVFHFKVQPCMDRQMEAAHYDHAPAQLDQVGRVVDFSVVKSTLCEWLENNWDHKFLAFENDPLIKALYYAAPKDIGAEFEDMFMLQESVVFLPFNPTAENLAAHMVNVVGPMLLTEHGVELVVCTVEETSKCHVEYQK